MAESQKRTTNTKVLIGVGVVVLLLVLGSGYMLVSNTAKPQEAGKKASAEGNVFSSVKDALSKSVSLECAYEDEMGNKVTAYIKAGAIRSDVVGKEAKDSGSVIMKDKKMYAWQGKEGFMMTFDPAEMVDENNDSSAQREDNPGGDIMEELEKFKDRCKPAVVSDALFTPPTDVKFTDMSALIEQMKTQPTNGAMSEEQLKKLQEQYQR